MSRHRSHAQPTGPAGFPRGLVLLGLIVGLGLTFFVGMHYGRNGSSPSGQNAIKENRLSRLDRQEAELRQRRAQERARLSFHSTLAGPARKAKRPASTVAQKPKSTPATAHKSKAARPQTAPATELASAKQDVSDQTPADNRDKISAQAEQILAGTHKAEPKTATDEAGDDDDSQLAVNSEASHFSLQVGAFPDASAAQNLVERLSQKGYAVRIVSADVEGKGTWYRVRVGDFTAREKAEQKCSQLSDHEGLFALVVPEKG